MSHGAAPKLSYSVYLSQLSQRPYDVDSGASVSVPHYEDPNGRFIGHYVPPKVVDSALTVTTQPAKAARFADDPLAAMGAKVPSAEGGLVSPENLDIRSWDDLRPFFENFLSRPVDSVQDLEKLILDYNRLLAAYYEAYTWADINLSRYTNNEAYKARVDLFKSQIKPKFDVEANKVNEKIARHPLFQSLPDARYAMLKRLVNLELEMYNEKNVPLLAELAKLEDKYGEITGGITVVVRGETMTVPKARSLLRSSDRELRREAWLAVREAYLKVKPELDALYGEMVQKRHEVALNAGFDNFRDYAHKARKRFDYTVADTHEFRKAIAEGVVPVASAIYRDQQLRLGLADGDLRPWDAEWRDMAAAPGEEPLHPFQNGDELIAKSRIVQSRLSPEYGEHVRIMAENGLFDVEARPNKRGGGYNATLPLSGMTFIFMNAVGSQGDLKTMQHELGHAHQAFWTVTEPLMAYQDYPAEIAETASMAMEFLSMKHWDVFYADPAELTRSKREQLQNAILFLPWCAVVDGIQQWVYTHPDHTTAEREAKFRELMRDYGLTEKSYEGLEDFLIVDFMLQGHIYWSPFYYIEYGIAQLGALQIYRNSMRDEAKALADYKAGLSLGYSKPLPEVWRTLGIDFDFSAENVKDLMDFLRQELEKLE